LKVLRLLITQGNPLLHRDSLTIGSFDSTVSGQLKELTPKLRKHLKKLYT